jgi:hypothetical protein
MANESERPFQFSLLRLLLATAVFAAVCGLLRTPVAMVPASAIALIALIAKRHHVRYIVRSFLCCAIGVFVAGFFCPAVHPPYEPGDEFRYMMAGAFLGWLAGLMFVHVEVDQEPGRRELGGAAESPPDRPCKGASLK